MDHLGFVWAGSNSLPFLLQNNSVVSSVFTERKTVFTEKLKKRAKALSHREAAMQPAVEQHVFSVPPAWAQYTGWEQRRQKQTNKTNPPAGLPFPMA